MMSPTELWVTLAGLTVVTVMTRSFFLVFGEHLRLPPRVQRVLRYAPIAALVGIIVPDVLLVQGQLQLHPGNLHLVGAVAAVACHLATRNMLLTILGGMAALTAMRLGFGG